MITENLDLFFADFGVSFTAGAISGMCIKDQVIQVDYQVIVKSSLFGGLLYNDYVTVDGLAFVVKETMPVEDGVFSLITLEKLMQAAFRLLLEDGFFLLLENGSSLFLE